MTKGPLLQAWLEKNNRSQWSLAREVGISQSMMNKICRGERSVNIRLAYEIAGITGLHVDTVGRVFRPKGRKPRKKTA